MLRNTLTAKRKMNCTKFSLDSHSSGSSGTVTISHAAVVIHLGDGSPPTKGLVHRFHRLLGLDEDDLEKNSEDGALMKLHHGAAFDNYSARKK